MPVETSEFNKRFLAIHKRGFEVLTYIGIFFIALFAVIHYETGYSMKLALFDVLFSFLLFLNFVYYRVSDNLRFAVNVFTFLLLLGFTVLYVSGGFERTGFVWMAVFPSVVFFFYYREAAFRWLLAYFLVLFSILLFYIFGYLKLPYTPPTVYVSMVFFLVNTLVNYFVSSLLYELVRDVHHVAITDPLTGLYNRGFALSYLGVVLEKLARKQIDKAGIAYIDLDNFKRVNDTFGHNYGDHVLRQIAHMLKNSFRKSDIVARIGGDEFLVIFENSNISRIEERLENLKKEIEKRFSALELSMSYGVVKVVKQDCCIEDLLREADDKMYKQKLLKKLER